MTFDERAGEAAITPGDGAVGAATGVTKRRNHPPAPILVIMHGEHSSPGRIGMQLQARGHALDIRKPRFGHELPRTLAGHAGVVVFGGPMSCNDCDEYLRREIDFVGEVLAARIPFLGICLGVQMLAKQLGASVGRHPDGKVEIGYHPLLPTAAGASLGPWPARVYHWHREGFALPSGAVRLAEGAVFENQAFRYGQHAVGLQFHPEITYALINRWTTGAKDWQFADGAQERTAQFESHLRHTAAVGRWLAPMLGAWLESRVAAV